MDPTHEVEILLVEDNPTDIELTLRALTSRHLANQLFVCRDGAEAIDFFFGNAPNALRDIGVTPRVILLDLNLPKVDGLEVLRRATRHRRRLPTGRQQLHRQTGRLRGLLARRLRPRPLLVAREPAAAIAGCPNDGPATSCAWHGPRALWRLPASAPILAGEPSPPERASPVRSREPRRRRGRKAVPPASGGPPPPPPPPPPPRPAPPAAGEPPAASAEPFRALVEHSTAVITLPAPDGTLLYASQSAQPVLGYAYQENIGRKAFELIHPDDVAAAQAFLRQVAERPGEPQRTELRARHKNGSWRDLEAVAVNRLREPAIAAIVVTYRDVTERRRADRIQRATYRISEAAHRAETLHELFRAIHEIVGGLMPANNFYIALYDPESDIISFPYFVDQYDSDFPPKRPGKGLTEYVLRTGAPLLVTPEVHRELEQRGYVELIGAPSIDWLGVPLTIGDNTIGVLV